MGWTGEINTLEELEALMCDNVLPAPKYPDAYYRLPRRKAVNLYNEVRAVAVYVELPEDRLEELFGKYDPEDKNVQNGLFDRRNVTSVADRALKQELEENRRGNPTQIHDFEHYLPRSYFLEKQKR